MIAEIGDADLARRAIEFDVAFRACDAAIRIKEYGGVDGDSARATVLSECAVRLLEGR